MRNIIQHILTVFCIAAGLAFCPATASADDASAATRISGEAGMGILFGAVAGGVGLVTPLIVGLSSGPPTDRYVGTALITGGILYPIGIASGAILGGYLTDTKCGYWEPFVGAFAGAAIADVTAFFLAEDYPTFSAILVIALPIITTMVAMETSHYWGHTGRSDRNDAQQAPRAFMPLSFGMQF